MTSREVITKKYKSPSTGEPCTAAQLVVEILMTRKLKKDGKAVPIRFWNIPKHKAQFTKDIIRTNAYLKVYDEKALIRAITKNDWIYSIYFPGLEKFLEEEQELLDSEKKRIDSQAPVEYNEDTTSVRENNGKTKNIFGKLRDLD